MVDLGIQIQELPCGEPGAMLPLCDCWTCPALNVYAELLLAKGKQKTQFVSLVRGLRTEQKSRRALETSILGR